jgi:transcriptional regulator with XRE-family HTH domain
MFAEKEKKRLGLRIRRIRELQGWTQSELAAKADVSHKHLGELERGRGNPSLRSLQSLAVALHISLSELFDSEQEEKSDAALRSEIMQRLESAQVETLRRIHRALKP